MKCILLITIIIALTFFSCTEKTIPAHQTLDEENQTPEVLTEDYESSSSSSYKSKRAPESDIINKLFNEAMDRNADLKKLNDLLNAMRIVKNDSVAPYRKYAQTNNNYWMTVHNHISTIDDSLLKESTIKLFNNLETEYMESVSLHESKLSSIGEKTIALENQLVLMKLIVTAPMMKNYQVNELPDIETLEALVNQYSTLLKETKKYTKLKE